MVFEWHIFLWHIAITVLSIYTLISGAIFYLSKRKIFGYYAIYLILIGIYIFDKTSYDIIIPVNSFTRNLNWYLQIIYHFVYFWFSFGFLNYFYHFPKDKKKAKTFTFLFLGLGTINFIISTILGKVSMYIDYFNFVHVPIIILAIFYLIFRISKVAEPMKKFYTPGILFYILFSLIALFLTFKPQLVGNTDPLTFLYLGILIETAMFSVGLGYLIKQSFEKSLATEKKLNQTQKELHEKLQVKLDKTIIEREINSLKVSSLQNQMNSHFIFNVLNSLKTFITDNDQKTAVKFLNKYAKLTRIYLNGSEQPTNTIEKELETIKLYLELENQRLNNSILFSINIHSILHLNQFEVPSNIFIPFLENAIWKGIFHNEDEKKIDITISQLDDNLTIHIKDNGTYNEEITYQEQENTGLDTAYKRIKIYNKLNNKNISYSTDYSKNGGLFTINIPKKEKGSNLNKTRTLKQII